MKNKGEKPWPLRLRFFFRVMMMTLILLFMHGLLYGGVLYLRRTLFSSQKNAFVMYQWLLLIHLIFFVLSMAMLSLQALWITHRLGIESFEFTPFTSFWEIMSVPIVVLEGLMMWRIFKRFRLERVPADRTLYLVAIVPLVCNLPFA